MMYASSAVGSSDWLVQVGEGTYLGKAHVNWWWGRWQRVGFFSLIGADSSS